MKWMIVGGAATLALIVAVAATTAQDLKIEGIATSSPVRKDKVVKTDAEWRKLLPAEAYKILRNKGTEPAFCGVNLDQKGPGVYHCLGCNLPLFVAANKFDSGTGWPSFYQPFSKENIWIKRDTSYGMLRTEVLCSRCDGHLGHVFNDGPKPTGLRYCINGNALKFVPGKPKE